MDVLIDDYVWVLTALWVLFVGGALLYAVLAALGLWRRLKAARATAEPVLSELTAAAERAQAGADGLQARQGDLLAASEGVKTRANAAIVVGKHAGEVAQALRFPVRFLAGL